MPPTLFGKNEFNSDVYTTSVYCGVHNCGAVNSYGDLYTWGKNKERCLGLGDHQDQYFPFKVNMGGEVKKVSLGFDHSLALCKPYLWSNKLTNETLKEVTTHFIATTGGEFSNL